MSVAISENLYAARDAVLAHPVATLVIDRAHVVIDANAAAEDLFNLASGAMAGVPVSELLQPQSIALDRILDDASKSFSAFDVSVRLGRSGEHRVDLLISPAHDEHGYRIIALPHDGGSTKGGVRRPGSAARSATGAAAMLAHEIKNPLSGIRGAAQLMENAQGDDVMRFSRLICAEVDRVTALIDAMQNFTRDAPLDLSLQNIYPAINQACELAKVGFAREIVLVERFDPSLPKAMISHDGLVQILINLIKNASEALVSSDAPTITISTSYRHGLSYDAEDGRGRVALPVEIDVSDNGPGVSPELIEDMFSPFVTGRALGDGNGGGQGLGLAMVDKLIREMGGLVRYHRDAEQGTTHFRLHLPISGHEA